MQVSRSHILLVHCAMAVHNPLAFTPADAAPLHPPGDWHGGHWSQGLSKTKTSSALLTPPRTRRRSRSTLRDHQKLVTTVQSMPPHGTPSKPPWTSLSAMQRHARQLKITAAKQRDASELQLLREQVQHLQEQVQHSQSELDTTKQKMKNMFTEEKVLQQFSDIKREFVTLSDVEALHEQIKTLKQEIASSTVRENKLLDELNEYKSELAAWMDQCIERCQSALLNMANLPSCNYGIVVGFDDKSLDGTIVEKFSADRATNAFLVGTKDGQTLQFHDKHIL